MSKRIAVVGVGLMGSSLARHLVNAGFPVIVHDVDPAKVDALVKLGAKSRGAREIAGQVDVVMLSLPNSHVVNDVLINSLKLLETGRKGLIVVDCSTPDPDMSLAMAAQLRERGIEMLDGTISGTSEMFAEKDAIFMVGGSAEAYRECEPIFQAASRGTFRMGANGTGANTKLVVNLVLSLNRMALAEGLTLAAKAGSRPGADAEGAAAVGRGVARHGAEGRAHGAAQFPQAREHAEDFVQGFAADSRVGRQARLPAADDEPLRAGARLGSVEGEDGPRSRDDHRFLSRAREHPNVNTGCRLVLLGAIAAGVWAMASATRAADAYPSKSIRIVCPFPPGGGADAMSRLLGQKLTDRWGRSVVIDNRAGASDAISAQASSPRRRPTATTEQIDQDQKRVYHASHRHRKFACLFLLASQPSYRYFSAIIWSKKLESCPQS